MGDLIQNAVLDKLTNTFYRSNHVHDYVPIRDGFFIDGGLEYIRNNTLDDPNFEDYSLYFDSPTSEIVSKLLWGTYGKDGKSLLKYVRLQDCTTEHLKAILNIDKLSPIHSTVCNTILSNRLNKHHYHFLSVADTISQASKDPSTKVGAVIVDKDNRIVSTGYNGFPKGIDDTEDRLHDRETKLSYTLHAELNAVLFARRDLSECTLYTTFVPCSECAKIIIQTGIKKVYSYIVPADKLKRWGPIFNLTYDMFKEAGVDLRVFDKDKEIL